MSFSRFPRFPLCHLPTPLQRLDRLGKELGGPTLWIKRDDCTGLGLGGNKVRKLEYLLADAVAKGATRLLTAGPLQSNHCRQTAAAATRAGLECELLIDDRIEDADHAYRTNGNILLDRLFGAILHVLPGGADADAALASSAEAVRAAGGVPYIIPVGASTPLGALGYVNAALEIQAQAGELGICFDHIVHASGSAGTHAGLLAGQAMLRSDARVHAVNILGGAEVRRRGLELARQTAQLLGHPADLVRDEDVIVHDDHVGSGFGKPTEGMLEAIALLGRLEGILLDPVHTGKAMAGLIAMVRNGSFKPTDNVLFIHTGGQPSLFAYAALWSADPVTYVKESLS